MQCLNETEIQWWNPTTNGGVQNGSSVGIHYTLHTRFCTFGTELHAQSVLINKISALEFSRKFLKSALLVGKVEEECSKFFLHLLGSPKNFLEVWSKSALREKRKRERERKSGKWLNVKTPSACADVSFPPPSPKKEKRKKIGDDRSTG